MCWHPVLHLNLGTAPMPRPDTAQFYAGQSFRKHDHCAGVMLGPSLGEIHAIGTPVPEQEKQTGTMQHSRGFGRVTQEDALLTQPLAANSIVLGPVYRCPSASQASQLAHWVTSVLMPFGDSCCFRAAHACACWSLLALLRMLARAT